jgi:nitrogen fixation/metabolism regulation signal transduction histidine kinase
MGRASSANWPWQIVAILPESDIIGVARGSDFILIGFVLVATALALVIGFLLARNIGQPLVVLWTNAKLARNGNIELMTDVESGYKEIDETAAILLELAEKRRHGGSSSASRNDQS